MGRWSRDELESAADRFREAARKSAASGDWSSWAKNFTEDATYVEHHFGRFCGREAISKWVNAIMAPYPTCEMIHFPWTWHVIDEERGWVICELMNRMRDPGDGSIHEEPNITILHYAGNNLWSYEEDAYDWKNMVRMMEGWQAAKDRCEKLAKDGVDPLQHRYLSSFENLESK